MRTISIFFLVNPGPRPPFGRVVEDLWGFNSSVDTDGNSSDPTDTNWTELTARLRTDPNGVSRIDVDPVSETPLVLKVVGSSPLLAERVAGFLAHHCSAEIVTQWPPSISK
jgi:hypothetical protein